MLFGLNFPFEHHHAIAISKLQYRSATHFVVLDAMKNKCHKNDLVPGLIQL